MAIDMSKVKFVQVVDDPADDNDEAMEDVEYMEENSGNGRNAVGMLSKSWAVESAHVPTFTGGRVAHSYHYMPTKEDEDADEINRKNQNPFLLLPVHGDLAFVDATKGIKLGTIRGGSGADAEGGYSGGENFDDDDEEEGVDQDAITAYALDHKNQSIVTCSRNNMLRQYSVVRAVEEKEMNKMDRVDEEEDEEPSEKKITTNAKLAQAWGRSGHTLPVTIMAYHDSDVFLATGSVDGTVRIWDVRGKYVTHVFRPLTGGSGGVSLGGGRPGISSITWRPGTDKLIVAIGREDGSISIHDLRDPMTDLERVVVLRDHLSAVTCTDWWGDEFFVSTGRDAILNLWRIVVTPAEENNGKSKKKNNRKGKNTKGGDSSPPADKVTYRRVQTIPVYEQIEGMAVLSPALSSDNEIKIITAGSKGCLRRWKAEVIPGQTPELVKTLEQPRSQSFGEDRGGYMGLVLNHTAVAEGSPKEFLIAVDAEHNLSFVDHSLTLGRTIVGHNDEILDLKIIPFSLNSSTSVGSIVVATNSPQVRIFDLENFSCSVLDGHTATVLCVDASPCGRYLASAGKDKTLRIWSSDINHHHRCLGIAEGHTEPIGACGFSQKVGKYEVGGKAARNGGGAFCVTASVDKTIKRWNLLGPSDWGDEENEVFELEVTASIRGHDKDINILSVAPNDSLVASGSQDKTIKLWDSTDLSLRATLKGHRRGVWDCQFSPIDKVLATSSGDKTIKLWSLSDYSCVRTFQGHLSSVLRVRFLSTGLQLVSSGADGLVKLWTIRTNECETTLDGHSNKVWAMDLMGGSGNASGDVLVSGAADSKILVWEDTTVQLEDEERAKEAELILLDQQMANHLRHKEYDRALDIALKVNKPGQALKVLNALLENEISSSSKAKKKSDALSILQKHVATWDIDRIAQVAKYCREWNTRAKNASLAMWVIQAIVTTVPVDKLTSKEASATEHGNLPEIFAGITPYAERHFDRLDRLHSNTYLLDFMLSNMVSLDQILGSSNDSNNEDFEAWEATSKPVLPPKFIDGRIQVGGKAIVGGRGDPAITASSDEDGTDDDDDSDAVMTVGDSSLESESEDEADKYDGNDCDSSSDDSE